MQIEKNVNKWKIDLFTYMSLTINWHQDLWMLLNYWNINLKSEGDIK